MAAASLVTFARELYQRTRCRIVGVLFDPRWNCASQRGVVKMSRFQVPLVVTRCLNYFAMNWAEMRITRRQRSSMKSSTKTILKCATTAVFALSFVAARASGQAAAAGGAGRNTRGG